MPRWPILLMLLALPAAAQVRTPGQSAVSEHAGPIGDDSGPVGEDSRSMYEGRTIGESSVRHPNDERIGGSVRDRMTRSMRSGPVSSLSSGSMRQPRTLPDAGSQAANSAGAVKHDFDQPLGSRISQPLRELAPLQAQLREIRQHGDAAAIAAAEAPASAEPAPVELDEAMAPDAEPVADDAELAPEHLEEEPPMDTPEMAPEALHDDAVGDPFAEPEAAPLPTPEKAR